MRIKVRPDFVNRCRIKKESYSNNTPDVIFKIAFCVMNNSNYLIDCGTINEFDSIVELLTDWGFEFEVENYA